MKYKNIPVLALANTLPCEVNTPHPILWICTKNAEPPTQTYAQIHLKCLILENHVVYTLTVCKTNFENLKANTIFCKIQRCNLVILMLNDFVLKKKKKNEVAARTMKAVTAAKRRAWAFERAYKLHKLQEQESRQVLF